MTSVVRYSLVFALVAFGAACGDEKPLFPINEGGGGGAGGAGGGGAGGSGGEGGSGGCAAGFADCDGMPDNGCEVDISSDAANCGGCLAVCLGDDVTCTQGECSGVTELAGMVGEANHIIVDDENLYWTTITQTPLGEVHQIPKHGGAVIVLGAEQPLPGAIAVNDTTVFWANLNSPVINQATIGMPPATLFAEDSGALWGVAADAQAVYWTRDDGDPATSGVVRAPLDGGAPTLIAMGGDQPYAITIDADSVFWTDRDTGEVLSVPHAGGTPVVLADLQAEPYRIAQHGDYVYWTNNSCNQGPDCIMRARKDGTEAPMAVAGGQSAPYAIAVDAENVYWTDEGYQRVMRAPIGGGTPEILAATQPGLVHMTMDDMYVYWANESDGGSIRKLRK